MPIDATQPYDDNNIFARILRGELPSKTVFEDEFALAFHDINPVAPAKPPTAAVPVKTVLKMSAKASGIDCQ